MSNFLWRTTLGRGASAAEAPSSTLFGDSVQAAGPPLSSTLSPDIARTFRQLGVSGCRASVVDTVTMAFQAAWLLSELGEVADESVERPLDNSMPVAVAVIDELTDAADDDTLAQRLSTRRWGLAWRLGESHAVLAEVQFFDRREALGDADKSLLRLVCSAAMRPQGTASAQAEDAAAQGPVVPQPHAGLPTGAGRQRRLSQVLVVISALLAAWLALATVPELQRSAAARDAQSGRLQVLADKTLVRGVATALAGGDYGEVQSALSMYGSLGYFEGAAVLNLRQRVVALSGRTDPLRIGDAVPRTAQRPTQVIDLALGTERLGQLLILPAPAAAPAGGLPASLVPLAVAAALAAAAAAVATLWTRRRPRTT